jgi:hypothetical protein
MMRIAALALIFAEAFAGPAAAKDPTDADWMIRMMVCTQDGSPNMEVYLPQSIVFGKKPLVEALAHPVIGYYTLDLTDANKGKPLEPVKVSMTADGKTVIVQPVYARLAADAHSSRRWHGRFRSPFRHQCEMRPIPAPGPELRTVTPKAWSGFARARHCLGGKPGGPTIAPSFFR